MSRFTFTLDGEIVDPAQLFRAARDHYRKDNAPREVTEQELDDLFGTGSEPDLTACLIQLLDPGNVLGCDIDGSSAEIR